MSEPKRGFKKPTQDRYPERRTNREEDRPGEAPTHEVTALNAKTGAKGTVGVGWLRHGADGTYLSLSLLPFVVLDGSQSDIILNVFERDFQQCKAEKNAKMNAMREPTAPTPKAERPHIAALGDPNRSYRDYMDDPTAIVLRPSEFASLYEVWMEKNRIAGTDRDLIYPSDFVSWVKNKAPETSEESRVMSAGYRAYLEWGVDDPDGTLTYQGWLEYQLRWMSYKAAGGTNDFREFLRDDRQVRTKLTEAGVLKTPDEAAWEAYTSWMWMYRPDTMADDMFNRDAFLRKLREWRATAAPGANIEAAFRQWHGTPDNDPIPF